MKVAEKKRLIGGETVMSLVKDGTFHLDDTMILTPVARDLLFENRVMIITGTTAPGYGPEAETSAPCGAPICMNCPECAVAPELAALESRIRELVKKQLNS